MSQLGFTIPEPEYRAGHTFEVHDPKPWGDPAAKHTLVIYRGNVTTLFDFRTDEELVALCNAVHHRLGIQELDR